MSEATQADVQSIESVIAASSQSTSEPAAGIPQIADTGRSEETQKDSSSPSSFLFDGVTKSEDGSFVFQAPTGSVYKGASMEALWTNITKGVVEKDTYISSLKAKTVTADEFRHNLLNPQKQKDEIAFPDRNAIFSEVLGKYGIDPAMASWDPLRWDSWAIENNIPQWQIPEYRQNLREASRIAEAQYADQNKRAFDAEAIAEETEAIQQIIGEEGIDAEEFAPKYHELLQQVYNDPKSRNKIGMLKKGVVVAAAVKAINQMRSGKVKTETRMVVEKEISEAQKKLSQIKPEGASRSAFSPPAPRVAKTLNDAKWDIIRSMQSP